MPKRLNHSLEASSFGQVGICSHHAEAALLELRAQPKQHLNEATPLEDAVA